MDCIAQHILEIRQMSGSKRGLHEFRALVHHSGQDAAYSTGLKPLLARSCGQANLSVLLLTLLPQNIAIGLSQEENYKQLGLDWMAILIFLCSATPP